MSEAASAGRIRIEIDDLSRPQVHALLEEHLANMHELSPPEGGAGRAVLAHIVAVARQRGYRTLSLETGSHPAFLPAQALHRSFGFASCGPFGSYREDPHSVFMSWRIAGGAA